MKSVPSALLPILRSQVAGDLLALLYLHPEAEYSLTEAATTIGASLNAVHYEAGKLSESGLISTRRRGNLRLVRAVTDSLLTRPLTDLLAVTYGPLPGLTDLLADVERIATYTGHGPRGTGASPAPPRPTSTFSSWAQLILTI
jgi:DNA-binding transcriptional ArsR family regulator